MTEDRSNAALLGAPGILSGTVSWALSEYARGFNDIEWDGLLLSPLGVYPGLVFGLIIGFVFRRRGKIDGRRQVGYVLAAALAYFCAFHVALHVADHVEINLPGYGDDPTKSIVAIAISGIPTGIVGSVLLGCMTTFLLRVSGRSVLRLPVLVGGAAGVLLGITAIKPSSDYGVGFFFAIWQGVYAASLAPLLRGTPRK